nr:uncharacterized protein LOC111417333 isoform X2 [Onthophagus taurus]
MKILKTIYRYHSKFVQEMQQASQFDSRTITLLPSIIFLVGSFSLIYQIFHKRNTRFTPTRLRIYRELGFHWTYFYIVRMWLVVIKGFKMANSSLEHYVSENGDPDSIYFKKTVYTLLLMTLLIVSSIPLTVVLFKYYMRETIPDFLMIGQDPWLRSEIGLAGHYLDRPPNFTLPNRPECAYRSKRSCSNEDNAKRGVIMRSCKSMMTVKCVKSIQELIR